MPLLVLGALSIGFGTLVLLGLLTLVRELFCESPHCAPRDPMAGALPGGLPRR
jgi:hypothetical protein